VSPILDKQSGQAVALVVIGEGGRQFVVTVDPQQPSRLLLQDKATRGLYALQVRWEGGCRGRHALRHCLRLGTSHVLPAHIPTSATITPSSAAAAKCLSLSLLLVLLTALLPQTRVDRVNINSRPAMEMLFSTPGWEQRLQQLR
jgi:hypothetical protein